MEKTAVIQMLTALTLLCAVIRVDAQDNETAAPDTAVSSADIKAPGSGAGPLSSDTVKSSPASDEIRSLLRTVNFEFNSAALKPESREPLDSVAALFKRDDELRYEVQGHTDFKGNLDYNKRLSMARAISVKNYLVLAGVPAGNIVAIGYGAEKPIGDNKTEEGRAANRRVEIVSIDSREAYHAMRAKEAALIHEVRQADIKGFEELPHDIVAIPELEYELEPIPEPKPAPVEEVVIEDEAADTAQGVVDVPARPDTVVQIPNPTLESAYSYDRRFSYLLSVRPELLIVLGEISSVGGVFEFGFITKKGLFLSADIGGGIHYYGAGLNLGGAFTSANEVTVVFGLSGNYHSADLMVYFEDKEGNTVARECGVNKSYAGVFWKVMPRKASNLDITNRILFGRRRDSAWYDREEHEIYRKSTYSVTYSLTVGVTLIKRSN